MVIESEREDVAAAMRRINEVWLRGKVQDLAPLVHPDIAMVVPGLPGSIQGRERFLAGFDDFCRNAVIHEFQEREQQVDVVGETAVVSFGYQMVYERSGSRYRVTGRDLWVFQKQGGAWIAVWRTMLDTDENPA